MASRLRRSKRTVGKRLETLQARVAASERRPAPRRIASRTVKTVNIQQDAVTNVELAPGSVSPTTLDSTVSTSITTAQSTADGKNTIFYSNSTPTATKAGDLWFNTTSSEFVMYRATAAGAGSWTQAVINGQNITAGTIDANVVNVSNINAGDITAGTLSSIEIQAGTPVGGVYPFRVLTNGNVFANAATIASGCTVGPLSVSATDVSATWDSKIVSIYTNNAWGGGNAQNWAKIGVAAKETGTAISLYTPRGAFVFGSDAPGFWPYVATSLTWGKLDVVSDNYAFIDTDGSDVELTFRSSAGVGSNWGSFVGNGSLLSINHPSILLLDQDVGALEYVVQTAPITGAGGAGWAALYWSTVTGAFGRAGSSASLKENIISLEDVGSIFDELRPVSFILKARPNEDLTPELDEIRKKDIQYGFIAEEVAEIANGHLAVFETKDGEFLPVDWRTRDMIAVLVKEVQSLRARVAELENA